MCTSKETAAAGVLCTAAEANRHIRQRLTCRQRVKYNSITHPVTPSCKVLHAPYCKMLHHAQGNKQRARGPLFKVNNKGHTRPQRAQVGVPKHTREHSLKGLIREEHSRGQKRLPSGHNRCHQGSQIGMRKHACVLLKPTVAKAPPNIVGNRDNIWKIHENDRTGTARLPATNNLNTCIQCVW